MSPLAPPSDPCATTAPSPTASKIAAMVYHMLGTPLTVSGTEATFSVEQTKLVALIDKLTNLVGDSTPSDQPSTSGDREEKSAHAEAMQKLQGVIDILVARHLLKVDWGSKGKDGDGVLFPLRYRIAPVEEGGLPDLRERHEPLTLEATAPVAERHAFVTKAIAIFYPDPRLVPTALLQPLVWAERLLASSAG